MKRKSDMFDEREKEKIRRLYKEQHLSVPQLAERFSCHRQTIAVIVNPSCARGRAVLGSVQQR